MKIELHHYTAEELWDNIMHWRDYVKERNKNKNAKSMTLTRHVPNIPILTQLFDGTILSDKDIVMIKHKFINEIYDENIFNKYDHIIENEFIPLLYKADKKLKNALKGKDFWFPENIKIFINYGTGASYGVNTKDKTSIITFGIRAHSFISFSKDIAMVHEYIHTLIEETIIKKYNVPQELKERIVDLIGKFYFDIPVEEFYENSFANSYITKEAIETDLSGAVQKMMNDYNKLQNMKLDNIPAEETIKSLQHHH